MQKLTIAAASAAIALTGAASATNVGADIDLCAAAVNDAGLANVADYNVKFDGLRGASVKRLSIELIPNGEGEKLIAECRIKRGEIIEVALKD